MRGAKRLSAELRDRGVGAPKPLPSEAHFDAVVRDEAARQAREQPVAGHASIPPALPRADRDLPQRPLRARARGLRPGRRQPRLGRGGTEQIVFAHTHQPLADVRPAGDGRIRYWNTGSWIYEPDLGSRQAYARYLRYAWPGTAVLIDTRAPSRACSSCSPTSTRCTAAPDCRAP